MSTATLTESGPGSKRQKQERFLGRFFGYVHRKIKKRLAKDPPVLGQAQQLKFNEQLAALSDQDRVRFEAIANRAKSPTEKDYLKKALAANHKISLIEKFAKEIQGKDETWMRNNLKLTGNEDGKGVKQQYSHSCGPTTAQAVLGHLDPVYALIIHRKNKNITQADKTNPSKDNPTLAQEQMDLLESEYVDNSGKSHRVIAVPIAYKDLGEGRPSGDLMNKLAAKAGVKFTHYRVDPTKLAQAIKAVETGLSLGLPVPISIGNLDKHGKMQPDGHAVLVIALDKGPPKTWTIHDPAKGETKEVEVAKIEAGKMNLAGWNVLRAINLPSGVK